MQTTIAQMAQEKLTKLRDELDAYFITETTTYFDDLNTQEVHAEELARLMEDAAGEFLKIREEIQTNIDNLIKDAAPPEF